MTRIHLLAAALLLCACARVANAQADRPQVPAPVPPTIMRDEIDRSIDGAQSQPDVASFLSSSLWVIVLLLGVVFVVLISLTLLARRRL